MVAAIDWGISDDQVQALADLSETFYEGKLAQEDFIRYMKKAHDPSEHIRAHAENFDTNKDGFISADEYERIVKCFRVVYPNAGFSNKTFEDFVAEADLNADGKVSIDECTQWIKKLEESWNALDFGVFGYTTLEVE